MRISKIVSNGYKIINEKDFDYLGIIDSITDYKICTFIEDEKYISQIKSNVSMIITTYEIYKLMSSNDNIGFVIVDSPKKVFFDLHNSLCDNGDYVREEFNTRIGKNCHISKLAYISPKNVVIGDNVTIEEFVSIKSNTVIGDNCFIGSGSVIGGDGFEYKKYDNKTVKVKHYGGVILENNVSVDYNSCIDKAIYPWDDTLIKEYTRIDNLVHIAHACKIGKRVFMPAGSVIAGRVEIGDDSWIGIGVSIRNGLKIGKNARCNMGAVVTKNVADNESVTGNFAIEHSKFIENLKNNR